MKKILNWPFLILIRLYQIAVGPLLPPSCIYTPGCSTYMYQAIEKYGLFKGGWMGTKRILRCHPWAQGGHDPVP